MKRFSLYAPMACLVVGIGLLGQVPAMAATRTETRTEKLAYGAKLWVKNRNGAITVVGWDREEVQLSAEIRDSDRRRIELVLERVGPDLDIEAHFNQPMFRLSFGFAPSPRCEMTLNVPRRLLAHFRTTNGQISVANLDGYAHCETTNGDIRVRDFSGEALTETCNGTLEARRLKARIKGGTTNGRIDLEDVEGGVHLETSNGPIRARNLDGWGEGISLESSNGAIDLELGRASGEIQAETNNGSIEVKVPGGQVLESSKRSVRVKVPGRSQKITLETSNGSIRVH